MAAKPTDAELEAWEAFLTAHAGVMRALERELREERDLPLSWYEVLLRTRRAPGRHMRMRDLAASVLLTPSGLTRVVDRMEEAGLVQRRRCHDDRRGWNVHLTERGAERLRAAAPVHLRGIEEHFSRHLSGDESTSLHRAMSKVIRAQRAHA